MAKVTSPLFSQSATGSLYGGLTYQAKGRGHSVAFSPGKPTPPGSYAAANAKLLAALSRTWASMSTENKAAWQALDGRTANAARLYYLAANTKRARRGEAIAQVVEVGSPADVVAPTAAPSPAYAPLTDPDSVTVTGTPSPDCTGNYHYADMHHGKKRYLRDDGCWKIWWSIASNGWVIQHEACASGSGFWFRADELYGDYFAYIGIGTPTVIEYAPPASNPTATPGFRSIALAWQNPAASGDLAAADWLTLIYAAEGETAPPAETRNLVAALDAAAAETNARYTLARLTPGRTYTVAMKNVNRDGGESELAVCDPATVPE
jgi:hypothetical protein